MPPSPLQPLWRALQSWLPRRIRPAPPIANRFWRHTLSTHPFLAALPADDQTRLRLLSGQFLQEKEFHGAHGLVVNDAMALAIAAQACLPLLHVVRPDGQPLTHPLQALDWYDDFVGIVVQPGAALARREVTDGAGVVHRYQEALAGEAMDRGPVMLAWTAVAEAPSVAAHGTNVVIHEFVHKMDMRAMPRGQHPDGAPPLFKGFLDSPSDTAARQRWRTTMQKAYAEFREAVALAERFGGERPWLDAYAAQDPAEFFAVTSEAYFVNRERFTAEFPPLRELYDGFFRFSAAATP